MNEKPNDALLIAALATLALFAAVKLIFATMDCVIAQAEAEQAKREAVSLRFALACLAEKDGSDQATD